MELFQPRQAALILGTPMIKLLMTVGSLEVNLLDDRVPRK
jgi:hypothetical protein